MDTSDNCATLANPDQHDEDADGRGDVCDNCPGDANAPQEDGDGDGVGDLCDPRPLVAGDRLAFFDPFKGTSVGTGYQLGGQGSWSVGQDELRASPAGTQWILFLGPQSLTGNNYLVATRMTFQTAAPPVNAGIMFRINSAGDGWLCLEGDDGTASYVRMNPVTGYVTDGAPYNVVKPGGISAGTIWLRAFAVGTQLGCIDRGDNSAASGMEAVASSGLPGLRVTGANVSFKYLAIYAY